MRVLAIILVLLFCVLQYDLWIGEGSIATVTRLQHKISTQKEENKKFSERNDALVAEVHDLKTGDAAIEERARTELGMIKKGETYIQVVDNPETEKNQEKQKR